MSAIFIQPSLCNGEKQMRDGTGRRAAVMAGLAALAGCATVAVAVPNPDAALVAACGRFLDAEAKRDIEWAYWNDKSSCPEFTAFLNRIAAENVEHHGLRNRIAMTPVATLAGLRAKAMVMETQTRSPVTDDEERVNALVLDVLRLTEAA